MKTKQELMKMSMSELEDYIQSVDEEYNSEYIKYTNDVQSLERMDTVLSSINMESDSDVTDTIITFEAMGVLNSDTVLTSEITELPIDMKCEVLHQSMEFLFTSVAISASVVIGLLIASIIAFSAFISKLLSSSSSGGGSGGSGGGSSSEFQQTVKDPPPLTMTADELKRIIGENDESAEWLDKYKDVIPFSGNRVDTVTPYLSDDFLDGFFKFCKNKKIDVGYRRRFLKVVYGMILHCACKEWDTEYTVDKLFGPLTSLTGCTLHVPTVESIKLLHGDCRTYVELNNALDNEIKDELKNIITHKPDDDNYNQDDFITKLTNTNTLLTLDANSTPVDTMDNFYKSNTIFPRMNAINGARLVFKNPKTYLDNRSGFPLTISGIRHIVNSFKKPHCVECDTFNIVVSIMLNEKTPGYTVYIGEVTKLRFEKLESLAENIQSYVKENEKFIKHRAKTTRDVNNFTKYRLAMSKFNKNANDILKSISDDCKLYSKVSINIRVFLEKYTLVGNRPSTTASRKICLRFHEYNDLIHKLEKG